MRMNTVMIIIVKSKLTKRMIKKVGKKMFYRMCKRRSRRNYVIKKIKKSIP